MGFTHKSFAPRGGRPGGSDASRRGCSWSVSTVVECQLKSYDECGFCKGGSGSTDLLSGLVWTALVEAAQSAPVLLVLLVVSHEAADFPILLAGFASSS